MRQPTPTNVSPRPPSRSTRASGSSSLRTRGLVALLTLAVSGSVVSPVYAERGADSPANATPPTEEQAATETPSYPACEGAPGEGDVAAAKGAFQAGRTSFEEGDYERAILYWEDAFRRDCTAVKLLLNVGRAYELNGDLVRAVAALETYVARDTALEDRAAVERRIAKLKARVQQQQENAGQATNAGEQAEEAKQTKSEPSTGADDHQAARPVWPVVVTAAGVVGLAVGATFTAL